ncbi:MAG: S-layer homology domain-containing protein, partial [Tumebacillaceae bacterium]
MKKGKKITAAMTAWAVVAAIALPTVASASVTFSDISNSFAKEAIQKLADAGIVHGTNGAFNPNGTINKQDFTIILVNALGLDVSAPPSTPTFSDVPTTSYAYKYVEAAAKAGIVHGDQGKFGYNANLERQQMALMFANAAKANVTGKASKLNFSDNNKLGTWAADAVGYAVENGWIHGFDGKFDPTGSATRAQVAVVASAFLDTIKGNTDLKITASATNVAIGEKVALSVAGATNVAWSVDKNGVVDAAGNFVGTAAGTATVTATVNGKTLTQAISVYGVATGVSISTPKNMIANKTSKQTITVNAVDANGNKVNNFNGTADVSISDAGIVVLLGSDGNAVADSEAANELDFTNGVATIDVQTKTDTAGLTATLSVANLVDTTTNMAVDGYETATADINTVEQVATAIKVTSDKGTLAANAVTHATVTAQVVDQDGVVMTNGVYGLTIKATGPVKFDDTADLSDHQVAFDSGSPDGTTVTLDSIVGKTGSATITVTGEGLTTGTLNVKLAVASDASKLVLTNDDDTNTTNAITQGDTEDFTLTATDENGTPVTYVPSGNEYVYITDANGDAATGLIVTAGGVDTAVTSDGVALGANDKFTISADDAAAAAGTYKVVVKDTSDTGALEATASTNVIVNAATADTLSLSAGTNYVGASAPTTSFTAKVTDKYGNKVAKAGVPVVFTATSADAAKASFNGKALKSSAEGVTVTVNTDANGVATANFTTQGYNNVKWSVVASATSYTTSSAKNLTVVYQPTASMKIALTGTNGSTTQLKAGDTLTADVQELDAYGASIDTNVENDTIKVTASNASAFNWTDVAPGNNATVDADAGTVTGTVTDVVDYLKTVTAHRAGSVTLTVSNVSVPNAKTASSGIKVVAGTVDDFKLFDA